MDRGLVLGQPFSHSRRRPTRSEAPILIYYHKNFIIRCEGRDAFTAEFRNPSSSAVASAAKCRASPPKHSDPQNAMELRRGLTEDRSPPMMGSARTLQDCRRGESMPVHPRPTTPSPDRTSSRRHWLTALAVLCAWAWCGDAGAASVSAARGEAGTSARKHHCKCSSDCDGNCCCVARESAHEKAPEPVAPTPSQPTDNAPATRSGGPCLRSVPCGSHGIPTASPVVPVGKFADCVALKGQAPRERGTLLPLPHTQVQPLSSSSPPDDPPEPCASV